MKRAALPRGMLSKTVRAKDRLAGGPGAGLANTEPEKVILS